MCVLLLLLMFVFVFETDVIISVIFLWRVLTGFAGAVCVSAWKCGGSAGRQGWYWSYYTHTGTVNAASLLFISAWGSVNMDKVCHAVRWWEGVEREEEKRSKKRREHRHGQKLKSDVTGEKCTASGGCGTLISLLCYIYCWYPITVSLRIKLIQLIRRQQLEPFVLLRPAKSEERTSRVKVDLEFCPVSSFPFGSPPITLWCIPSWLGKFRPLPLPSILWCESECHWDQNSTSDSEALAVEI